MLEWCLKGNCEEVKRSVEKVLVDESDDDGVTALQIAAAKGHRNLVCKTNRNMNLKKSKSLKSRLGRVSFVRRSRHQFSKSCWNDSVFACMS